LHWLASLTGSVPFFLATAAVVRRRDTRRAENCILREDLIMYDKVFGKMERSGPAVTENTED
jgi:hypothetical protein